jgi:hypothetical protein
MRIKALIIPQRTKGNISIVGSYRDKSTDKEMFLMASGKKVVTTLNENDRVFQYTFEEGFPLTLNFDSERFEEQAVIEFWKKHPLVFSDGYDNPNLISQQFKFEIKEEKIQTEYSELLGRLQCIGQVSNMTFQEQMNLAFALGSDPREMSPMEVYLHLVGLTLNGIAIARKDYVKTYLSVRANERIATVYANKAMAYKIIQKDGPVYKIGGRNAGTTMDAVVAMLLADTDTFENYIKPEVDKYDVSETLKLDTVDPLDLPEEIKNLLPVTGANDKRKARKPGLD